MTIETRMQRAEPAGTREFTGRHMLAILCAFFGVTIAVNLTLAWFANSTWSGLVVPNSYVASQGFNAGLEAGRREQARGWRASFDLEGGRLAVSLADRAGAPLAGLDVSVAFARPAHEGEDHAIALVSTGDGRYEAAAPLAPGLWTAEVVVRQDGEQQLKRQYRFVVKP
jgi:nitrogen fixation protein FixH